ncbi:MAG: caspase family protein [Rhodoferax sp.]|nr:caspase family protein [Rhodoferax sp.]
MIGNDAYKNVPRLGNARNDAALMAATLKKAGFDVTQSTTWAAMRCGTPSRISSDASTRATKLFSILPATACRSKATSCCCRWTSRPATMPRCSATVCRWWMCKMP